MSISFVNSRFLSETNQRQEHFPLWFRFSCYAFERTNLNQTAATISIRTAKKTQCLLLKVTDRMNFQLSTYWTLYGSVCTLLSFHARYEVFTAVRIHVEVF